ncbi:Uncharacterized protein HZ326_3610 [Fusarium oxysporum f. sp. albedinis]|nr:Uncharacterized protein HZ326_3610 [Fusarium oxysporum f. sp. albedinis]
MQRHGCAASLAQDLPRRKMNLLRRILSHHCGETLDPSHHLSCSLKVNPSPRRHEVLHLAILAKKGYSFAPGSRYPEAGYLKHYGLGIPIFFLGRMPSYPVQVHNCRRASYSQDLTRAGHELDKLSDEERTLRDAANLLEKNQFLKSLSIHTSLQTLIGCNSFVELLRLKRPQRDLISTAAYPMAISLL